MTYWHVITSEVSPPKHDTILGFMTETASVASIPQTVWYQVQSNSSAGRTPKGSYIVKDFMGLYRGSMYL